MENKMENSFSRIVLPSNFYGNEYLSNLYIKSLEDNDLQTILSTDDDNYIKLNKILSLCVRIENIDGTFFDYKEIKTCDRLILLLMIWKNTFDTEMPISVAHECSNCSYELKTNYQPCEFRGQIGVFFIFDTICLC